MSVEWSKSCWALGLFVTCHDVLRQVSDPVTAQCMLMCYISRRAICVLTLCTHTLFQTGIELKSKTIGNLSYCCFVLEFRLRVSEDVPDWICPFFLPLYSARFSSPDNHSNIKLDKRMIMESSKRAKECKHATENWLFTLTVESLTKVSIADHRQGTSQVP
jgi:hypothetical protein